MNRIMSKPLIPALTALFLVLVGCGSDNKSLLPNSLPVLSALSVDQVTAGSENFPLTISGDKFVSGIHIRFGDSVLTPTSVEPNQMTVQIAASLVSTATVIRVSAMNPGPGGGESNALDLTVNNPLPQLSVLSLSNITAGTGDFGLVLDGTDFVPDSTVNFGNQVIRPARATATRIEVTVPATAIALAQTLQIAVTNPGPGGGVSNPQPFAILNPVPALSAMSIDQITAGSYGFTLSVTGKGFAPGTSVQFGSNTLVPTSSSSTELQVIIPSTLIAGGAYLPVSVVNPGPGGGASNARTFTVVNPVPQLSALSSNKVVIGSSDFNLEVTGSNFVPQTELQFGSASLRPGTMNRGHMQVGIPRSAFTSGGVISVRAVNPEPGGGVSSPIEFTIENPVPVLASLSPISVTAAGRDVSLTLKGEGFVPGMTVTAGSSTLEAALTNSSELQTIIPAALVSEAGTITFSLRNPGPGGGTSGPLSLIVRGKANVNWRTVANTKTALPGTALLFNSFNTPSVNRYGAVAVKAQSKGQSGPVAGIFLLDPNGEGGARLTTVADNNTIVPAPNTLSYNGALTTFTQFPSFARIDRDNSVVVFRAQNKPTVEFILPDGTESRVGSAGLYSNATGSLTTAVGLFGALPDYAWLQVPGVEPGIRFSQFPGSPSITNQSIVAFKGNYTVGDSEATGVFYRDLAAQQGKAPVELIASSVVRIPNQPEGGTVLFGSTAPPSAADGMAVFTGWDNEDTPTMGGIYAAPLTPSPALRTLVGIGDPVPGEQGATFSNFGEGLAFDGRFVGFWATWGTEKRTVLLTCKSEGEVSIVETCNAMYPNGHEVKVPLHQGIFVYDLATGALTAIARTGPEFQDFVYWNFSGRPPGVGGGGAGEDAVPEPPRWRSSSFVSVSGRGDAAYQVAFKAQTGGVDGVYLGQGPDSAPIETVCDTLMLGEDLDALAPGGSGITSVGMEREGLRGDWLVVGVSMLNSATSETGAGVYLTNIGIR